jgi:hypothetical protein
MGLKSKLENYKKDITDLLEKGVSIRSAWRIIVYEMPSNKKISYNAFRHFIHRNIR